MPEKTPYRFLFSAGGTGGHIFPALAVAKQIKQTHPDSEFLFVGANGKMEMEKVPNAGFEIKGLNISGLQRSNMVKNLTWPFKLISSLLSALSIVKKFKPNAAAGFGGFASGPAIYASSLLGVPCMIQEQNSFAGITNRLLGGKVKTICTSYEGMEKFFPKEKIELLGNPVRREIIENQESKDEAQKYFELEAGKPTILVFGGSQGALAINKAIAQNLDLIKDENVQLIWQTGKGFIENAEQAISDSGIKNVKAMAFINEMEKAYAAAEIVVCRSGAISISELSIVAKPCIFIPLPTAAEDHQTKNAKALEEKGAGMMVENSKASEALIPMILALAGDQLKQEQMANNIKEFAKPRATEEIAQRLIDLAA